MWVFVLGCTKYTLEAAGGGSAEVQLTLDGEADPGPITVEGLAPQQLEELVRQRLDPVEVGAWVQPGLVVSVALPEPGWAACGVAVDTALIEVTRDGVYLTFADSDGNLIDILGFVDTEVLPSEITYQGAASTNVHAQCLGATGPEPQGIVTVSWSFDPETLERHTRYEWDVGPPIAE